MPSQSKRTRLPTEVRRGHLIAAARDLVIVQGYLPLRLEDLAATAGVSKGLVYAYFPTQHALFNAVLELEFAKLVQAGLLTSALAGDAAEAGLACGMIYFEHVARHGPAAHIILRDGYMARRLDRRLAADRDRVMRILARKARRDQRLCAREAVAAINMILTIPEETGRLAFDGELPLEEARALCANLIPTSVRALRP